MLTIFDIEVCPDNWLISFKDLETGKYTDFWGHERDVFLSVISFVGDKTLIGFNSEFFDMPILAAIMDNRDPERIKALSDKIINERLWPWATYRYANLSKPKCDHIDVMGVSPGFVGLKAYGGRMHMPTIQDLPFDHTKVWTPDMYDMVKEYCHNDLDTTEELVVQLEKAIELRVSISNQYGIDVRSSSDTQVAEKLLCKQLGLTYKKNIIPKVAWYEPPDYLLHGDKRLVKLAEKMREQEFEVNQKSGHVKMPSWLVAPIKFEGGVYKMGIGGLHSQHDKKVAYYSDDDWRIFEIDAASFYPTLLINRGFAAGLSNEFIKLYKQIYDDRLKAKAEMKFSVGGSRLKELKELDKVKKIMLNGTFGKLASKGSRLYSLESMLYITMTGQLTLLELIKRVTDVGAIVVSANTDGLVVKVARYASAKKQHITGYNAHLNGSEGGVKGVKNVKVYGGQGGAFRLLRASVASYGEMSRQSFEFTEYEKIAFANVNNYISVKTTGGVKRKGTYAIPGLQKNPVGSVCANAVAAFMEKEIPFADTIKKAKMKDFVTVRTVNGGAVQDGEYLGKVCRWYYSKEGTSIHYATNGNLVPKSTGGKACMTMPKKIPDDLDYGYYWRESRRIAVDIGLIKE